MCSSDLVIQVELRAVKMGQLHDSSEESLDVREEHDCEHHVGS